MKPARVIALANQKGGVGKTTTAINLSACLAERGKKTLLIDLDPQANATSGLGLKPEEGASIYGPLLGEESALDKIQKTPVKGLDIIPSEVDLAGAEIDVARAEDYLYRFQKALAPVLARNTYAHVIIDCPPSLGILTVNALVAAHGVLIPIQCEYYALEGLSVIAKIVGQLQQSGANPNLDIEGIVMTMFDGRTKLSLQVVTEVRKFFGEKVFDAVIPRTVRLSEAPGYGLPIVMYDRRSPGAEAYRTLTREFLKRRSDQAKAAAAAAEPPHVETPEALDAGTQAAPTADPAAAEPAPTQIEAPPAPTANAPQEPEPSATAAQPSPQA